MAAHALGCMRRGQMVCSTLALGSTVMAGCSSRGSGSLLQIANGRWVTDMTTFAYLADVFVLPSYQGNGLGKWFVTNVLVRAFDTQNTDHQSAESGGRPHPYIKGATMRLVLHTATATTLYERYAEFEVIPDGEYVVLQIGN